MGDKIRTKKDLLPVKWSIIKEILGEKERLAKLARKIRMAELGFRGYEVAIYLEGEAEKCSYHIRKIISSECGRRYE